MSNWWIGMCLPEDCDLPPHTTLPAHSKLWAACMPYMFSLLFGDPSPQCYNYLCTWRWHLENHVSTPQHTLHNLNFACHWCLAVFESACKQYVQLGVQHNSVACDCSFRDTKLQWDERYYLESCKVDWSSPLSPLSWFLTCQNSILQFLQNEQDRICCLLVLNQWPLLLQSVLLTTRPSEAGSGNTLRTSITYHAL